MSKKETKKMEYIVDGTSKKFKKLEKFFKKNGYSYKALEAHPCENVKITIMTVAEYSAASGYSKAKVYGMLKNGKLNAVKDENGQWRIHADL